MSVAKRGLEMIFGSSLQGLQRLLFILVCVSHVGRVRLSLRMWFLDERPKVSQPKTKGLLLTTGVEYVVGRKDCKVLIEDDASISRKHSVITVQHNEANLSDPSKISQVFLEDFSKYGTFVNGLKISGTVTLKNGDNILFGKNNSFYSLRYSPLVVVTSCLEEKKKKTLKSQIHKLGGHMIGDWRPNITSHLVMDGLTFTVKVIHALAECCPIITPSYFDDITNPESTSSTPTAVESYLPPLKEDTISSQGESFLPREGRRTLFSGKSFIFISKKQFKRVHHAIKSSGGSALLKDTPGSESDGGLVARDVCVMMMDNKEQNTLPSESQQWVWHVMETLRRHRCRPIPESELGLALLFMSLEKYCNPSITAVPSLTQNLVSQSFQAVDMSQQIAAHETQFKKPSTPVKRDMTYSVTCEKQNMASTTAKQPTNKTHFGKRCASETSTVESIPDSQDKPPSTKRRKVLEAETSVCLETPLVSDSLDANKSLNGTHKNIQLELADSIVADSLETKHDIGIELNGQPKEKEMNHELMNKVENIADSLDVSSDSHMALVETVAYDGKEEKAHKPANSGQKEAPVNQTDRRTEQAGRENINSKPSHKTANEQCDKANHHSDIHVPAGFLCSRIPRKLSSNTAFEDEEAHLPRNLVVVDQMSLVVRACDATPAMQKRPENTTTKNFKRFTKQLYPGSHTIVPRIIGGSDLVVHQSSERLDKDDWFVEAREADAERQREERRAEELFRWEERATKSRRLKR